MPTNIYFISGGPCTGKTSVVNELRRNGYDVLTEAARRIAEEKFPGRNIGEIDRKLFQDEIFKMQKILFGDAIKNGRTVFSDRGFGDTIAYYKINNLKVPENIFEHARTFSNFPVFVLDKLDFYKTDGLRRESEEERERIQEEIINSYLNLGHGIINVPFMSIEKRIEFILKKAGC